MGVSRVRVKKEPVSDVQVKRESEENSPQGGKRKMLLEEDTDSAIESALFASPAPTPRQGQAPLSASSVFSPKYAMCCVLKA